MGGSDPSIMDGRPRRAAPPGRSLKPLIVGAYTWSSLARPLVAAATAPWHVLVVRIADRIGKGVRGAPRDALLAQVTPREDLGRAYGFHRAMDHAGAVVGPLIASVLLLLHVELRTVFALAALPALASVLVLVFAVQEVPSATALASAPPTAVETPGTKPAPRGLGRLLAVIGLFTLGNSSDAFLLLRAQDAGVALPLIPILWTAHHVVKSAASTAGRAPPAGAGPGAGARGGSSRAGGASEATGAVDTAASGCGRRAGTGDASSTGVPTPGEGAGDEGVYERIGSFAAVPSPRRTSSPPGVLVWGTSSSGTPVSIPSS